MRITLIFPTLLLFILLAAVNTSYADRGDAPQLVYHQNAEGEPLAGSIADLMASVRSGHQIRVYMNLGRVEHLFDSGFISIFGGHVYTQIQPIRGQTPNKESGLMELKDNEHIGFYSTRSPYEMKWYEL